jgi:hypothetical protein
MNIKTRFLFFITVIFCSSVLAQSTSGITVNVDKRNGNYSVNAVAMNWSFTGSTHHTLTNVQTTTGSDASGNFKQTSFEWKDNILYKASIKWYADKPVVLFSLTLPDGDAAMPVAFPAFYQFPSYLHTFSFDDKNFAPPQFKLNENATPWLFFDEKMNTFIISPASDFIVSKMTGNAQNLISSGLNENIKDLPAHFTHTTILVIDKGIHNAWDDWGIALRKMYNRTIPANDADKTLKYFGYWTDNGADYYYNYDTTKGYIPTLLALRKRYEEEGIPLGYLQLDSWWYEKSIYDTEGRPIADHKNPRLPYGAWNRYGGLMSYTADTFLFPKGLNAFDQQLDLPLVTHNRWLDSTSPYHQHYATSGIASTDPDFWMHIIQPIAKAGVICYEQDWLNFIYNKTPQMASNLKTGNAFTDGMADACKSSGISMQYCMAMPRFFLQGLKYDNLTTIRTSDDRFEQKKWHDFIYTSQLGYETGAWPWCDVFKSNETGNMILSVLSAGPVGTGDAIGKENKDNIMKVCRQDGVLVKPDVPMMPTDQDYMNEAKGIDAPMIAYTYTKQNSGITTTYVFAFIEPKKQSRNISFQPTDMGITGKIAVFDPLTKQLQVVSAANNFSDLFRNETYTYYIIAPVTSSGIAFFGDTDKIVSAGKKRISALHEEHGILAATVLFAKGETSVVLNGYSDKPVAADKGELVFDKATHLFTVTVPSNGNAEVSVHFTQKK